MEEKVERVEIWKLVTLDISFNHSLEMIRDSLASHELVQHLVPLGLERDHTHVRSVTFVARAGVSDVEKADFHWMMSTLGFTTLLSISAGQ
jgi:hypothetical protein